MYTSSLHVYAELVPNRVLGGRRGDGYGGGFGYKVLCWVYIAALHFRVLWSLICTLSMCWHRGLQFLAPAVSLPDNG